jgi:hypothetical protein
MFHAQLIFHGDCKTDTSLSGKVMESILKMGMEAAMETVPAMEIIMEMGLKTSMAAGCGNVPACSVLLKIFLPNR